MRLLLLSLLFAASALAKPPPAKKPAAKPTQEELDARELKKFERARERASQVSRAMEKDHRKPTKANISGRWSTGANLCGQDFQFEQDGEKITGRGYSWGCTGVSSALKVSGSYRAGRLTLKIVDDDEGETDTLQMILVEEEGFPRFQAAEKGSWPPHLSTLLDCRVEEGRNLAEGTVRVISKFLHPFSAATNLRSPQ